MGDCSTSRLSRMWQHSLRTTCTLFTVFCFPGVTFAQVPREYGWYIEQDGKTTEIGTSRVKSVVGLAMVANPMSGYGIDGLVGTPTVKLAPGGAQFIVYQQGLKASTVRLSRLEYLVNIPAGALDDTRMREDMFQTIFGKARTDLIRVEMWRPMRDVTLRIEPIPNRPDMFRFSTAAPLVSGRYAIYEQGALHGIESYFAFNRGLPDGITARWLTVEDLAHPTVRTPLDSLVDELPDNPLFDASTIDYPDRALPVWMAVQDALKRQQDGVIASDNKSMVIVAEGVHGGQPDLISQQFAESYFAASI